MLQGKFTSRSRWEYLSILFVPSIWKSEANTVASVLVSSGTYHAFHLSKEPLANDQSLYPLRFFFSSLLPFHPHSSGIMAADITRGHHYLFVCLSSPSVGQTEYFRQLVIKAVREGGGLLKYWNIWLSEQELFKPMVFANLLPSVFSWSSAVRTDYWNVWSRINKKNVCLSHIFGTPMISAANHRSFVT